MAKVTATTSEKVIPIPAWIGLHESPDGDTKLKAGEATAIRNFRVTRDGNLQRRPGYRSLYYTKEVNRTTGEVTFTTLPIYGNGPILGMWTGFVAEKERFLVVAGGRVYNLWDDDNNDFYSHDDYQFYGYIGSMSSSTAPVHMFGFEDKVYFMNGSEYKVWDGTNFRDVKTNAYVPVVAVSVTPEPKIGSRTLEQINKLTAKRRVWLSPDGTGTVFHLPEKGWTFDYLLDRETGLYIGGTYTVNSANGTITFLSPPAQAPNKYEVCYTMPNDYSASVLAMKYSELFSGSTDSRVFIYGDGTNEIFYSSIDYDGNPRADYFPDLNVAAIGDKNTPVTALIRHYSKLVIFKSNSTWSCTFNVATLADGTPTEILNITPANKSIGNTPFGQTALVLNSPRSLFGNDVYEWRNNNAYAANLSVDERQAKRISDKVYKTLAEFDMSKCVCWDDNDAQEYWICEGGKALVHNYAVDAWYFYTNIHATCFLNFHKTLFFGDEDGCLERFDVDYNTDNNDVIDSYWESGSMSFGSDYMRKYSAMLWLGIKPTSHGEVVVTVETDRKPETTEKIVTSQLADFEDADFGNWAFTTNRQPHIFRRKIKAKKFVYYKLIFKNESKNTSATITASDIRVRYTGYTK